MTPDRFGPCVVEAVLGQGPLTVVYRARHEPLGRAVAVKALRATIAPSSPLASRLEHEALLLASLHHPGIIDLYDYVRTGEAMWLVLEYVEGATLEALLAKSPRGLDVPAALAIAEAVAEALAYAHDKGVVHRDLKPSNVLLSRRGEVKLVDFGVAHNDRLPSSPEPLGGSAGYEKPAYMAPEQLLGDELDARSDIFSLGVVLYQMLCGARPFEAPDARGLTQRIRHDAPARLSTLRPGLALGLEGVVEQCLEKQPAQRYPTARAMLDDLRAQGADVGAHEGPVDVVRALARAGLCDPPEGAPAARAGAATLPRREGVRRAATGMLVVLAAMVVGASVLHASAPESDRGPAERSETLELAPERAAAVRVLARPWADVYVDGQLIDTTPFARAIPLAAGTHRLHFRHPAAPDEQRVLKLAPGDNVLVEVEMKVPPPPPPPSAAPAPTSSTP